MPTSIREHLALHAIATLPALCQAQPSAYNLNSTTPTALCTAVIRPNNQNESSTPNGLGVHDSSLCDAHVGTFSKVHRKQYSVCEKLAILKKVKKMIEDDKVSMRTAAGSFYLSPSQISQWRKMERQLTEYASKKVKAMNAGPKSKFGEEGFENELLKWIFEE